MACYSPISGYRSRVVGASGKRSIVFSVADGFSHLPVVIPCGQCVGCRLERSRQWAIRCMHEAKMYEVNCFVTLTYNDESLPVGGTLVKKDFQDFMKRLRKKLGDKKVRYYHCGEYGDRFGRPHYHALLFGIDFGDKYVWAVRGGFTVWRSETLEALWKFGQSEIGSVTFESAAYVARYIMKKMTGELAKEYYEKVLLDTGEVVSLVPEYTTMSRRPGIGKPWLDKFMTDVYPSDGVVVNGMEVKPPRYYDLQHELVNEGQALEIARARRRSRRLEDETPERLAVREQVVKAKLARLERSIE